MGYPTKVQLIHRKKTADQYYINFPTAVAEAMDFSKGEIVEWTVADNAHLILTRTQPPDLPIALPDAKKNVRR